MPRIHPNDIAKGIVKGVLWLCLILLLLYGSWLIIEIISAVILAIVLSILGKPLAVFLREKFKLPKALVASITIVLIFSIFVLFLVAAIPLLLQQAENLSYLEIDFINRKIDGIVKDFSEEYKLESLKTMLLNQNLGSKISEFVLSDVLSLLLNAFSFVQNFLFIIFITLFVSFFIIKDATLIYQMIYIFAPRKNEIRFMRAFMSITSFLRRYVLGMLIQFLIMFTLYCIILSIFDIKNAFIIALVCAVLNWIPYLGPFLNFFLMGFFTLSYNIELDFVTEILPKLIGVLSCYLGALFIDAVFNQPFIYSKSVKSHPLEIFLIIMISGKLFGISGMILAVPGYIVIKVFLKNYFPKSKIVKSLTGKF